MPAKDNTKPTDKVVTDGPTGATATVQDIPHKELTTEPTAKEKSVAEVVMAEPVPEDNLMFALKKLHLRAEVTERLYSNLQARNITTSAEASRRIGEVASALNFAYRSEAMRILELLREVESDASA